MCQLPFSWGSERWGTVGEGHKYNFAEGFKKDHLQVWFKDGKQKLAVVKEEPGFAGEECRHGRKPGREDCLQHREVCPYEIGCFFGKTTPSHSPPTFGKFSPKIPQILNRWSPNTLRTP